jgi:hypothetical protein
MVPKNSHNKQRVCKKRRRKKKKKKKKRHSQRGERITAQLHTARTERTKQQRDYSE